MQFIRVNATAIYLARSMRIKFDWVYQPVSALVCIGAGWFASGLTQSCLEKTSANLIQQMIVSGAFYMPLLLVFAWFVPSLVGVDRREIITYASSISPKVRDDQ